MLYAPRAGRRPYCDCDRDLTLAIGGSAGFDAVAGLIVRLAWLGWIGWIDWIEWLNWLDCFDRLDWLG